MIKTVVFDLDGTLMDTSEGMLQAIRYAIKKRGLHELTDEEVKTFIGPPSQRRFAEIYGLTPEDGSAAAEVFRSYYKDNTLLQAKVYPGIYELCTLLRKKGIKTAVATYKREDYALRLLKAFHFDEYMDEMMGADMEGKFNKSDIIRNVLKLVGTDDYNEAVMVGDSNNDAVGAKELGIKFIGVTYGFGFKSKDDVNRFDNIGTAADTKELGRIILGE